MAIVERDDQEYRPTFDSGDMCALMNVVKSQYSLNKFRLYLIGTKSKQMFQSFRGFSTIHGQVISGTHSP
jgi:hypothetical protein